MTPDEGPHLTPDLPPVTEAPALRGEVRPHPEESRIGRSAPLPIPYGPDRDSAAARRSGRRATSARRSQVPRDHRHGTGHRNDPPPTAHR